jgi:hypothetical protein
MLKSLEERKIIARKEDGKTKLVYLQKKFRFQHSNLFLSQTTIKGKYKKKLYSYFYNFKKLVDK